MFDRHLLPRLNPLLNRAARLLVRAGVGADVVSWAGFALGMAAAVALAHRQWTAGGVLLVLSRVLDGLDGAVARASTPTDRGAFLDITLDFLFYASIPLAFAVADPARNALPAAALLAAFMGTGSSFLAFAALAAQRGLASSAYPNKGFYFLGGLTEGSETIACFIAMAVWPDAFATLAWGFAGLCVLTIGTRLHAGWTLLR